jgi:hypothetical protein
MIARIFFAISIGFLLCAGVSGQVIPEPKQKVDSFGPYRLGMEYKELQTLKGFVDDASRSEPAKGIKAAKIIDLLFDQPTIQRFFFQDDKLFRVSIIFGEVEFGEEQAKSLVSKQWGDPGPKQKVGDDSIYLWHGRVGMIMILPAQGGRQMVTLAKSN